MRSCGAGVIHVGGEGKYLDADGNEHNKLNENVLIEIGAAMALYGKKVILLVNVVLLCRRIFKVFIGATLKATDSTMKPL